MSCHSARGLFLLPLAGLLPAVKNKRVKDAILECHEGRRAAASRFQMGSKKSGGTARFNPFIVEKDGCKKDAGMTDRYVAFATNMPCRTRDGLPEVLPETYRRRWIIETGCRVIRGVMGKTCMIRPRAPVSVSFCAVVVQPVAVCRIQGSAPRRAGRRGRLYCRKLCRNPAVHDPGIHGMGAAPRELL